MGILNADDATHVPATTILEALADETVAEPGDFKQINIQVLQTGEVAYRMHPRDGGEYVGGVITI